jgi:hypothetical protein
MTNPGSGSAGASTNNRFVLKERWRRCEYVGAFGSLALPAAAPRRYAHPALRRHAFSSGPAACARAQIQNLDYGRKRHGEIDVASIDVLSESICYEHDTDEKQEREC